MKVIVKVFLVLSLVAGVISGCATKSDIDDLQEQINSLKSDQIQTISGQITAINNSLTSLQNTDSQLKAYIETLQGQVESLETASGNLEKAIAKAKADLEASIAKAESDMSDSLDSLKAYTDGKINTAQEDVINQLETLKASIDGELSTLKSTIEALQKKDEDLQNQINELKTYIDTELAKAKDLAEASFASLDEYNKTAKIVAGIQIQIENINTEIADIKKYTSDVKAGVEQALDALKTELQNETDEAVAALKKVLLAEIETASEDAAKALEDATDEITNAYTAAIAGAIKESETSMQTWVNNQLTGYYTIAQMDTQLGLLQKKIDTQKTYLQVLIEENKELIAKNKENIGKNADDIKKNADAIEAINKLIESNTSAIGTLEDKIKTNTADIAQLQSDLTQQKTEITKEYTDAIANACKADGVIGQAIQAKIDVVNTTIKGLTNRFDNLEAAVSDLMKDVSDLETALRTLSSTVTSLSGTVDDIKTRLDNLASISYIPKYSDHKERVEYGFASILNISNIQKKALSLRFYVYPASCAKTIATTYANKKTEAEKKAMISAQAVYTLTKADGAGDFVDMTVSNVTGSDGILTVTVSTENLGMDFFQGNLGASLVLKIATGNNNIQSEFIDLVPGNDNMAKLKTLYSTYDKNGDWTLDADEVKNITALDVSDMGLYSLDLSQFTGLKTLNVSGNFLTSLNLSKNTALATLNISGDSGPKALDLTNNTNLTKVICTSLNQLIKINLKYNKGVSFYSPNSEKLISDDEVLINKVVWQKKNVGASSEFEAGSAKQYSEAGKSCPSGYRVPTLAEWDSLISNHSAWTKLNTGLGYWSCSGSQTYSATSPSVSIFGYPTGCTYFSSTSYNSKILCLYVTESKIDTDYSANTTEIFFIRCVRDI